MSFMIENGHAHNEDGIVCNNRILQVRNYSRRLDSIAINFCWSLSGHSLCMIGRSFVTYTQLRLHMRVASGEHILWYLSISTRRMTRHVASYPACNAYLYSRQLVSRCWCNALPYPACTDFGVKQLEHTATHSLLRVYK